MCVCVCFTVFALKLKRVKEEKYTHVDDVGGVVAQETLFYIQTNIKVNN